VRCHHRRVLHAGREPLPQGITPLSCAGATTDYESLDHVSPTPADLDGGYQPFVDVDGWADIDLPTDIAIRYQKRLRSLAKQLPTDVVDQVRQGTVRAASLNSGALEGVHRSDRGLTLTMIEESAWKAALTLAGEPEAIAHVAASLQAYELVMDAATTNTPITEVWIRQLHATALAGQETYSVTTSLGKQERPLPLGTYKSFANHVLTADGGFHSYAPVDDTPLEMQRLVNAIRTPEFAELRPSVQAAFVHHALTVIHPFADGNGRVARLLASVFTLRAASVPFMVYADQKSDYLNALAAADAGNLTAFVRFVFDRGLDAMSYASELLEDRLQQLAIVKQHGNPPDDNEEPEPQPVADRLNWIIMREVSAAIADHSVFHHDLVSVTRGNFDRPKEPWPGFHRPMALTSDVSIRARDQRSSSRELGAEDTRFFEVWEADDPRDGFAFAVRTYDLMRGAGESFDVRRSDVHPEERASFTERFRLWVQRHTQHD
jgi:Fic family protein